MYYIKKQIGANYSLYIILLAALKLVVSIYLFNGLTECGGFVIGLTPVDILRNKKKIIFTVKN